MAAVPAALISFHEARAKEAIKLYQEGLNAPESAADWYEAKLLARRLVLSALRETSLLRNVEAGLLRSTEHLKVLRRLLAAPISQDQFKFICKSYSKDAENKGRPARPHAASEAATVFYEWRDKALTRWIGTNRSPTRRELEALIRGATPLIAAQVVSTVRRGRLAIAQEAAVVDLLKKSGWVQQPALALDQRGQLKLHEFSHKTKFATRSGSHEVDIACGLGDTFVLALECKVTNDATNSIKRINDVLAKARDWEKRWGDYVGTGAMLQGVIPKKQLKKLLDADVSIFWSHRLDEFEAWLIERAGPA